MDFKTFLIKRVMFSFFVSVTLISVAMALVGMIFEPSASLGYELLLSPIIFGFIASFPLLVKYSKHELSLSQALIRNVIHFLVLETTILLTLYSMGILTNFSIAVSLGLSILIIDLTVNAVMWMSDRRTAVELNTALRKMQGE